MRKPVFITRKPVKFTKSQLSSTGIYCIECIPTGRIYIGSSKNILGRWDSHKAELRKGTHINPYLLNAYRKYGADNFNFSVLEFCDLEVQFEREQFYLDKHQSYNRKFGFNIAEVAAAPPMTPETRKKQSKSLKRNTEFIEKNRKFMKDLHSDPIKSQELRDSVRNSTKVKENLKKLNESESHKKQVQELLQMIHNDPRVQDIVKNLASQNIKKESWRKSHGIHYVGQYTELGDLIKVYDSASKAGDENKIDRFGITRACKTGKLYKGFYWKFED